ncbi:hypothetical protein KCP75_18800 [Salmonella enterica subsp. enterica]|nr:hypothetical protein KCP75_18800 [Salmonella enterica subsp. enterica]
MRRRAAKMIVYTMAQSVRRLNPILPSKAGCGVAFSGLQSECLHQNRTSASRSVVHSSARGRRRTKWPREEHGAGTK